MANENEDIQEKNADNAAGEKGQSWVSGLIEKIEEKIQNIDTDFPLSGGEEPHHTHVKTDEETETDRLKEEHRKANLSHDLNIDFPLSGGEQ